jgi:deoxyhypusine synthase
VALTKHSTKYKRVYNVMCRAEYENLEEILRICWKHFHVLSALTVDRLLWRALGHNIKKMQTAIIKQQLEAIAADLVKEDLVNPVLLKAARAQIG